METLHLRQDSDRAISQLIEKEPHSEDTIRFQDCDPFGHLNNSKYIDYFINARENHLINAYNLNIYREQRRHGRNWVIAKTKITYIAPVYFQEVVKITTRLIKFSGNSVTMEGVMENQRSTEINAITWIEFRYYDLQKRAPCDHPQELLELFQTIVVSDITTSDFDKRTRELVVEQRRSRRQ